jgi:hypothetical protein
MHIESPSGERNGHQACTTANLQDISTGWKGLVINPIQYDSMAIAVNLCINVATRIDLSPEGGLRLKVSIYFLLLKIRANGLFQTRFSKRIIRGALLPIIVHSS